MHLYCTWQWQSIDELNKLRSLTTLFMSKNPIVQATESFSEETARYIVVAKITGLIKLNRTEVSAQLLLFRVVQ